VKILWIAETKDIEPSNAKAVDLVKKENCQSHILLRPFGTDLNIVELIIK
jgi:hypothetical protein